MIQCDIKGASISWIIIFVAAFIIARHYISLTVWGSGLWALLSTGAIVRWDIIWGTVCSIIMLALLVYGVGDIITFLTGNLNLS